MLINNIVKTSANLPGQFQIHENQNRLAGRSLETPVVDK